MVSDGCSQEATDDTAISVSISSLRNGHSQGCFELSLRILFRVKGLEPVKTQNEGYPYPPHILDAVELGKVFVLFEFLRFNEPLVDCIFAICFAGSLLCQLQHHFESVLTSCF